MGPAPTYSATSRNTDPIQSANSPLEIGLIVDSIPTSCSPMHPVLMHEEVEKQPSKPAQERLQEPHKPLLLALLLTYLMVYS